MQVVGRLYRSSDDEFCVVIADLGPKKCSYKERVYRVKYESDGSLQDVEYEKLVHSTFSKEVTQDIFSETFLSREGEECHIIRDDDEENYIRPLDYHRCLAIFEDGEVIHTHYRVLKSGNFWKSKNPMIKVGMKITYENGKFVTVTDIMGNSCFIRDTKGTMRMVDKEELISNKGGL